jgi:CheY-like chemotaxis protein
LILIADDEEEARTALTQIFELEGFRVAAVSNGAEALDYLAKSEAPRLIVFDLRMPVMDGPQLRAALLQDQRLKKIPVVVITAMDPSAAAGLSPLRVFRKPVDVDALLTVIRQHC